jgi:hypothetical protein
MKKMMTIMLALTVMGGVTAQASLVLVNDVFSANTVISDARFYYYHINNGNWIKRSTTGPAWSVSGGVLTNLVAASTDEQGVYRMDTVTTVDTCLTRITVSFDYTVGEGTKLYPYVNLVTGAYSGSGDGRITQINGNWYAGDFNNMMSGPEYNIKDGTAPAGTTGTALTSLVGPTNGTFSQTYDISGFGGGGFSLANVTNILCVFTLDSSLSGDGAISIDNVRIEAPFADIENPRTWQADLQPTDTGVDSDDGDATDVWNDLSVANQNATGWDPRVWAPGEIATLADTNGYESTLGFKMLGTVGGVTKYSMWNAGLGSVLLQDYAYINTGDNANIGRYAQSRFFNLDPNSVYTLVLYGNTLNGGQGSEFRVTGLSGASSQVCDNSVTSVTFASVRPYDSGGSDGYVIDVDWGKVTQTITGGSQYSVFNGWVLTQSDPPPRGTLIAIF